jgi:membrane fusion protein (multidrug efflux system)
MDAGLKAGDRVVVEGLQKVRSGVKVKAEAVTIEESTAPPPGAAPPAEAKGAQG